MPMPRTARLDISGGLYHVIARGVERRNIFRSDRDCSDFEERLSILLLEEKITLLAYVLMINHFHLVIRRDGKPTVGHFVQRLLTGYVGSFNLRYRRSGHLFQNRYKAILCEEDPYLTQLVRYVHLNPVRARLVKDPAAYRWSSHSDYLRNDPRPWIETDEVLEQLGGRRAYRHFVDVGIDEGHRADLSGSPGKRSKSSASIRKASSNIWLGGRVLGDREFARRVAMQARGRVEELSRETAAQPASLEEIALEISATAGIRVEDLRGSGRSRHISHARRWFVRRAVLDNGLRAVNVARYLRISTAAVAAYRRKLTS